MRTPGKAALLTLALAVGGACAADESAELARGWALFAKQCVACHGSEGRGDGEAAYLLYPKPRDFRAAHFRLVSTWEGVPTDDDLFRTISRGIPGSAMPAWGYLPEQDRWALVRYVKSLAELPLAVAPPRPPGADGTPGQGLITPPPEPADAATNRARAEELFAGACASCHGAAGKADVPQELFDAEGHPIRPRDLTTGVFKTEPTPENLYRRILVGMPGTPMPANDWAWGDDGWYLVRYILSLSSPVQRDRAEMQRFKLRAARVAHVPDNPDDGLWARTEPVHLHLMPLWWRYTRPEELNVQAVHDGNELALLLVWADDTHDSTAMRPQDFRDAAAVEFALDADPPFFAMGQAGGPSTSGCGSRSGRPISSRPSRIWRRSIRISASTPTRTRCGARSSSRRATR